MKKIGIIILLLTMSVYTTSASAFGFEDLFGGGSEDNSAVGGGLDTNSNGVGDSSNSNGVGDTTNSNGVGDTTNSNGLGEATNNDYDPKVDPKAYGDGTPRASGNTGYNANLNKNPFSSSADGVPKLSLAGIIMWLVGLMNQLVYVIIGASLVAFLYGILKMSFIDGHKPEAREQARKFMFWGIVSLFVMMSVWGLVRIFQFTLFGSGNLIIPRLK